MKKGADTAAFNDENKTPVYYSKRVELVGKFPTLAKQTCAREYVGNCVINTRMPSILPVDFQSYSPLYHSDTPRRVFKANAASVSKRLKCFS